MMYENLIETIKNKVDKVDINQPSIKKALFASAAFLMIGAGIFVYEKTKNQPDIQTGEKEEVIINNNESNNGQIEQEKSPTANIHFSNVDTSLLSIDNNPSQLVLDGQKIDLEPGSHNLLFTKENFKSLSKDIDIKSGESLDLKIFLDATDLETELEAEANYGKKMSIGVAEILKEHPEWKNLPIDRRLYRINIGDSSDKSNIELIVEVEPTTYTDNREAFEKEVVKDLINNGFDLDNYKITYKAIPIQ